MALVEFDLAGQNYPLDFSKINSQKTINMYLDSDEGNGGRTTNFLRSTPGLKTSKTLTGKCNGIYVDAKNYLWVIEGQEVVRYNVVTDNYIADEDTYYDPENLEERKVMGAIYNKDSRVKFAEVSNQLVLVDGLNLYIYKYADDTFQQYTPEQWLGSEIVDTFYNMFVFLKPDSKEFYVSNYNDANDISGTDFLDKDSTPDNLVTMKSFAGNLWAFGKSSIQVYSFNSSAGSNTPITQAAGSTFQIGCLSRESLQVINNMMFWIGADKNGGSLIFASTGDSPAKISNLSIEYLLQKQEDLSGISSYSYQQSGHYFYCLNLPSANTTLVYDITTKAWHERQYLRDNGNLDRHRAEYLVLWNNKYLVSDYENEKLYEMSLEYLDDDGKSIKRLRRSSQLYSPDKMIRISEFRLDAIVGDVGQEFDNEPRVYLRCSKDGGNTWGNEMYQTLGKKGDYLKTIRFMNPVGACKELVIELSVSDPCKFTILNSFVNTR